MERCLCIDYWCEYFPAAGHTADVRDERDARCLSVINSFPSRRVMTVCKQGQQAIYNDLTHSDGAGIPAV